MCRSARCRVDRDRGSLGRGKDQRARRDGRHSRGRPKPASSAREACSTIPRAACWCRAHQRRIRLRRARSRCCSRISRFGRTAVRSLVHASSGGGPRAGRGLAARPRELLSRGPVACLAARSSASHWAVRCSPALGCCCSTSRWRRSTRAGGRKSCRISIVCARAPDSDAVRHPPVQ